MIFGGTVRMGPLMNKKFRFVLFLILIHLLHPSSVLSGPIIIKILQHSFFYSPRHSQGFGIEISKYDETVANRI